MIKSGKVTKFNFQAQQQIINCKFDSHIANTCFKVNQKLSVLSRLASLLTFDKKRILFTTFFESQFNYCPLTWMFCNKRTNDRINKLHKRALIVYDDHKTSLLDLLAKDVSFTVHHTNIQTLLLEIYKTKHNFSENCLKNLFSVVNGTA